MRAAPELDPEIRADIARSGHVLVQATYLAYLNRCACELAALEAAGIDNTDAYGEVPWSRVAERVTTRVRGIGVLLGEMLGLDGAALDGYTEEFVKANRDPGDDGEA